MNCQSFEDIIDDLAREQLIEATRRTEALQHWDECATCSGRLKAEQSLTESLRALALEMNSAGAPQRVESFLLASFNEQRLSQNAPRARRWNYLSVAAAAVVLAAAGIGFAVWSQRVPLNDQANKAAIGPTNSLTTVATDHPPGSTSVVSLPVKAEPEIILEPRVRRKPQASPRRLQADRSVTGNVAELAATEVTTDFMPIGYVNSASLQDGGSVVRVELPRSTIVSMGFALNMDRSGERVKADVLMGADGLARAIRFVQ